MPSSTTYTFGDLLGFVESSSGYNQTPSSKHLFDCLVVLTTLGMMWSIYVSAKGAGGMRELVKECGVRFKRVRMVAQEIERKSFHLSGLSVPLLWLYTTSKGMSRVTQTKVAWCVLTFGWTCDIVRVYVPFVQRNWPLKKILRKHEIGQLCGACYFSMGCVVSLTCFPPSVAMTSIVWLVLGDLSAALIGRSFGGDIVAVKLGREGKKSLEGSVAMFIVCVVIGLITFQEVPLREYAVILGSLVATITELYEPFGFNDNLTIPIFSSLALHYGLLRVGNLCNA